MYSHGGTLAGDGAQDPEHWLQDCTGTIQCCYMKHYGNGSLVAWEGTRWPRNYVLVSTVP